ncbi:N-succinyl-L,L-diaminopimelate aminotransferase [Methyloversatilis universalis FAM5]|jgi:N-succinyldiaminopimelate aminotransferase|uniref:N-succinyl-L,L-diaminopimelate aminotransferase n=1 Tax=Methyloversatilis universalis (strain ATCC BAA-1314 / DSM 25237 / JCM 13912 / CCUG 52030 / FAM5) TaxID=1000565 RepID=F5RAF5_METUF|nr:succinyldiaminopimelate transaminase [Methyloversatilis universalis]EGK72551.1 N-succinyl-L,L-diaminopimelate aminotransferase [Methyloversatilis universalis FAM5]
MLNDTLPVTPHLSLLQPYPFERLKELTAGVTGPADLPLVRLSIGEPQHATPQLIKDALTGALDGLAVYPTTAGIDALRECIAAWLQRRYGLPAVSAATQVLPVNGSREALFSFAQCVIDGSRPDAKVLAPNPFYQIYEGAALLAGAQIAFYNQLPDDRFACNFDRIPEADWKGVQLVYVCSPANPCGKVMTLDEWRALFELADRHNFVIASDECYSEIYFDEAAPPLGGLQAAQALGRSAFERLVVFSSLSKRSNVPGLRSGFVAGDARLLKRFLLYRTYHGGAMGLAVQRASIAAWSDEAHVRDNRDQYRAKFAAVQPLIASVMESPLPDASFYLWARTPIDDAEFARRVLAEYNVAVLPGSYLARTAHGINPGAGFVRIALVAPASECIEAAERIVQFCRAL